MSETIAGFQAEQHQVANVFTRWHTYKYMGSLLMLYIEHQQDPEHPQYDIMPRHFEAWLDETTHEKRLIRCEGRVPDGNAFEDEAAAIRSERSEMGLLALWAVRYNIPISSFEPSLAHQGNDIIQNSYGSHQREEYWFYLVARQLPQVLRSLHASSVLDSELATEKVHIYINETITRLSRELEWPQFDFSFDHFSDLFSLYYPDVSLDLLDEAFFSNETVLQIHTPSSRIQTVSHDVNIHREAHIAQTLMADMEDGKDVFALMGNPHVLKMESIGSHY